MFRRIKGVRCWKYLKTSLFNEVREKFRQHYKTRNRLIDLLYTLVRFIMQACVYLKPFFFLLLELIGCCRQIKTFCENRQHFHSFEMFQCVWIYTWYDCCCFKSCLISGRWWEHMHCVSMHVVISDFLNILFTCIIVPVQKAFLFVSYQTLIWQN